MGNQPSQRAGKDDRENTDDDKESATGDAGQETLEHAVPADDTMAQQGQVACKADHLEAPPARHMAVEISIASSTDQPAGDEAADVLPSDSCSCMTNGW